MKILIPDYLGSQVLSGIRSLKDDYLIDHVWKYPPLTNFLRSSKFINSKYKISYLPDNPEQFCKEIIKLNNKNHYSAILPFGLYSYYAFSHFFKKKEPNIPIMLPNYKSFSIANNKLKTLKFAKNIGIDTPQTFSNLSRSDLNDIPNYARFPLVVKCQTGTGVDLGVRYVFNKEELFIAWDDLISSPSRTYGDKSSPIIQEFIPGYIHDACCLYIKGSPYGILSQVRELMTPIEGGPGAINITTNNPELCKIASKLMSELEWHGPAQVEFKYDHRDKKYKLIEINPKLWGTLDLSIKSGFNIPLIMANYLSNKNLPSFEGYVVGYRYIFSFPQSLYALSQYIRNFGLPNIKEILYSQKHCNYGLFIEDPIPEISRVVNSIIMLNKVFPKKLPSKMAKYILKFPYMT